MLSTSLRGENMPNRGAIGKVCPSRDEGMSITVCVPVYNVEKYLRECLDSIFNQDYENFDVVMIDDGSTDGSGVICDEYVKLYPQRATVVHKGNEGLLLARREGFSRAAGQYVMSVDSDDMLVSGALATVGAAAAKTGADVLRFAFTRERAAVVPIGDVVSFDLYSAEEKPEMLRRLCRSTSGSENPMCFKAVRRECVGADVNFSAFKGLTFAEDFLQTLTVYDRAETFCFLDATLYYYRTGSGITRAYSPHFYRDVCRCLDVAEELACEWEKEYSCEGLTTGLAACRLDSAAQYAEWMASQGDKASLDALRASEDFARRAWNRGAVSMLRFDRRLVIAALSHVGYLPIAAVAKARAARAGR